MDAHINTRLQTPLGIGTFDGWMLAEQGGVKVRKLLVRLPIDKTTEPHRNDSNCLTRRAVSVGLWIFGQDEVKAVTK